MRDMDKDVLSQKPSPCTLSPPLPPCHPLRAPREPYLVSEPVPLVASDQLSDFTICKKWLLYKVKFCLQKVHLKRALSLSFFLFYLFCFWLALLHKHLLHKATNNFLSQRKYCGFLPPFPALSLLRNREREMAFRLPDLSFIPHPVRFYSLHSSIPSSPSQCTMPRCLFFSSNDPRTHLKLRVRHKAPAFCAQAAAMCYGGSRMFARISQSHVYPLLTD